MRSDQSHVRGAAALLTGFLAPRGGDDRRAVVALGVARAGFGVAMIVAPPVLPRLLGADRRTASRVGHLARMVGVRELALGAGTLAALRPGADPAGWVAAQALSDAGDALTLVAALRRRDVNRLTGGLIALAGVAGALADVAVIRRLAGRGKG